MLKPEFPENEQSRIEELERFHILDSESEKDFNEVVELAAAICNTPVSLVTLIDTGRQWFKAKKGLDISETSRDISFCGHAILQDELFIVEDATQDKRFRDNPLVLEYPAIRFYAGMPLTTDRGHNLGTICVLDNKPRELNEDQKKALRVLSNQVSKLIELRGKRNQLQEKLKTIAHQNHKLESLNKLNTEMTAIISHDMRGPVSSMLSYLNSEYFQQASNEEKIKLFPVIKESVQGINNLIENLLEWSQSVGDFKMKPLNLKEYATEVIMLFQVQASKKKITFKNEVEEDIQVMADFSMLRFILRNLVGNAIKFTENGVISLSALSSDPATVSIAIKDEGVGISTEMQKRILRGDKKITTPGTQKEKGSGLGLKLINEFLEKHNSSLKIESEENKGSTFSFTLPKV